MIKCDNINQNILVRLFCRLPIKQCDANVLSLTTITDSFANYAQQTQVWCVMRCHQWRIPGRYLQLHSASRPHVLHIGSSNGHQTSRPLLQHWCPLVRFVDILAEGFALPSSRVHWTRLLFAGQAYHLKGWKSHLPVQLEGNTVINKQWQVHYSIPAIAGTLHIRMLKEVPRKR